jgi:hypothetical protein
LSFKPNFPVISKNIHPFYSHPHTPSTKSSLLSDFLTYFLLIFTFLARGSRPVRMPFIIFKKTCDFQLSSIPIPFISHTWLLLYRIYLQCLFILTVYIDAICIVRIFSAYRTTPQWHFYLYTFYSSPFIFYLMKIERIFLSVLYFHSSIVAGT